MKITIDIIEKHNACEDGINKFKHQYPNYDDTLINLLSLEDVSYSDKVWLVSNVVGKDVLIQWSIECSEYVADSYNKLFPNDNRVNSCIKVVKLFTQGLATLDELVNARAVMRAAACSTWSTARAAAWSATWSARAAESATESAAWSTAESAAESAESAARAAASRKEQEDINLSILIALLENNTKVYQ